MKKKLFNFIRIFISIGLLFLLVYRNRGNFSNMLESLKNINTLYLIIAAALYAAGISFIVFRWGTLLRAHGYSISRPFLWQSAFIGWFFNMFLPTSVGGDFYRVYDLYENKGVPINENISAVVIERIIGSVTGITLLIIAFFTGTFSYLTKNTVIGLLAGLFVILAFFIVLFFPRFFRIDILIRKMKVLSKIRPRLRDFHEILISYRHKLRYVFAAYCFSLFIQTMFITSYYFINLAMGMGLKYKMMLFTLPFVSVASSVPIAIGGMGIRENAAVFALESFGVARSDATLFSFIVLSIILINALIGGLVYVIKNIFYRSKGVI
jgi:glycosyltransferase 2 family protein